MSPLIEFISVMTIGGLVMFFIVDLIHYLAEGESWTFDLISNSIEYFYDQKIKFIKPSKKIEEYLNSLTDLVDIKIYRDELNNTSQNVNQAKRRAYDRIIKRQDKKKAQEIIDDLDRKIEVLKELNVK